jgi:hypothetical protein
MANEETPAGFLSRWSRRKVEVRQGVALDEDSEKSLGPSTKLVGSPDQEDDQKNQLESATPQKPALSMSDVQSLTQDSDYTQFMVGEVAPEVKNAAMKKLFADPHFNVMDRMDVYIDDYGQPDPLPLAMLRQMASAKFLNLFEEEDPKVVAQSAPSSPIPNTETPTHDHTDLRLQPDPASRSEGAGSKPV